MDETQALMLLKDGYCVVSHPYFNDSATIAYLRSEFEKTVRSFPEYKEHPPFQDLTKNNTYILGGFSALGNPASFHNPLVRVLREWSMAATIPALWRQFVLKLENPSSWSIEHVVDRMMVRPPGTSASPESWHRDEAPLALDGDLTFGGWLNLDHQAQYFSCVPGTHTAARGKSGFGKMLKSKAEEYNRKKVKVVVPPGHILVFYEHIVHEVLSAKSNSVSLRLFLGWRLSQPKETASGPMIPDLDYLITQQAVMPLKSGQTPPMYAKLHWTNHRVKLATWSQRMMKKECLEKRMVLSGQHKGDEETVVNLYMLSLRSYNFPMYHPYFKEEIAMLKPGKSFMLRKVGVWDKWTSVALLK